ncbi:MAG: class I SAM-dependent methyltransferase [Melioribacteraceae bacterium]|nr:class I SAM-dependent methyltransferase [Melioribacteraceae bacterium]
MGEWFKDWFASEEYLNVYSHRNKEDANSLLKLINSNISIPQNASILDSACGNGRHSEQFSKFGYNVVGFDLSKTLLKIAQKNKQSKNLDYFCSDIRNIPINKKFDVIFNQFTSFG